MSQFVVELEADPRPSPRSVGGKATALALLLQAGFPVLPGLCLTTAAFHLAMTPYLVTINDLLRGQDLRDLKSAAGVSAKIAAVLNDLILPDEVGDALFRALPLIAADGTAVAVRSSAVQEDSAEASFAGQYDTLLGVREKEAISEAVLACWRSFFNAQALAYRAHAVQPEKEDGMAVLVQPLLEAECAGICYTIDPVAQKRERIVVSSSWGLGVGVVDGTAASDTDWLYRDNFAVERRHIVEKKTQVTLGGSGQIGIHAVPADRSRSACLPEKWLQCIAQFAMALENLFGRPQEVEWAVAGGQVWLLQSRPITALPPDLAESPPFPIAWEDGDQFYAWEPAYYRGYKSDPPLPLEYDHFLVLESIREEACRFMGVERNVVQKSFNGRPYTRPIPLDWHDADRRLRHQALEDWQDRLFDEGRSLWDVWGPEVEKTTERLRAFDPAAADGVALADHLEEALAAQRRHAFIHPLCTWRPRQMYFEAYTAVSGASGPQAEFTAKQLLQGTNTPLTRLVDALYELAVVARGHAALQKLLRDPDHSILSQLSTLPQEPAVIDFRRQLAELLIVYGERHGHGYGSWSTVHTPTWREQPAQIMRLAAPYLDPNIEPPAVSRRRAQKERDQQVEAICAACSDKQAVAAFKRLLANGRHWWTVLEIHNHFIDQMAGGQLRHAIMDAAVWLVNGQILPDEEEVFWLTFAEILEALRAVAPLGLISLIVQRKAQHEAWARLIPPPLLGLPDASLPERPSFTDDISSQPAADDPDLIRGQAASPGQVTGQARVVQDETDLLELKRGDILIAHNVGPRWTPIFPLLGGLVLETGSVGQHAAVTAREYGIVAVIATGDAARRIPDRSLVFVDGTSGIVRIKKK